MGHQRKRRKLPSVKIKRTPKNGGLKGLIAKTIAGKSTVAVGIDDRAGKYPGIKGAKVKDVARWNALGTSRIPPRNFLREFAKRYGREYTRLMGGMWSGLLQRLKVRDVHRRVGSRAVLDMRSIIVKWRTPPNAKATIKRKGFNDPLIHTRKMLHSVSWKTIKG